MIYTCLHRSKLNNLRKLVLKKKNQIWKNAREEEETSSAETTQIYLFFFFPSKDIESEHSLTKVKLLKSDPDLVVCSDHGM